jgi:hypothetical protein
VSHPWPRPLNSGGNLSDAGDAAFDQGLVSFAEDGAVLAGRPLSEAAAVIPIRRQEIYGRSKSGRVRRSNHRISLHTPDGMLGRATFVAVQ